MVVIVGALFALVGVVYAYLRSTQTKTDERLEAHVKQDIEAHERLARLETKVETLESEVSNLRKRFHDTLDQAKKLMYELYSEFKAEVLRLIGK